MRPARAVLLSISLPMLALVLPGAARAEPQDGAAGPADEVPSLERIAARAPDLLARYIRIDTSNPPGNEIEGARFLADLLEAEGITTSILESEPGRASLYARLPGTGRRKALLLLNHIDVVPVDRSEWHHEPYGGEIEDGVVYGRGALDCKGVAVAQLLAMIALKRAGDFLDRDLVFLATADEETGGRLGAGWLIDEHFDLLRDVEFVLNEGGFIHRDPGKPLIYNLNAAEKAPCWFRVTAQGEPGHASRPPAATAVTRLVEALGRLVSWRPPIEVGPIVAGYYAGYADIDPANARRYRDLERSLQTDKDFRHAFISDPGAAALVRDTLTPTVLHASSKTNVVPATAWAEVDSRLLPGHECAKFLNMVRARVADVPQVRIDPAGVSFPASESPLENELTAAVERVAAAEGERAVVLPGLLTGFTDSHWFRERGVAAYGFAPIEATPEQRHAIHGPEESVGAIALEKGVERLVRLIRELSR
jgi:acetylornithine deacetylase/succinyl-diaminopimelate desuccinylase-like protein